MAITVRDHKLCGWEARMWAGDCVVGRRAHWLPFAAAVRRVRHGRGLLLVGRPPSHLSPYGLESDALFSDGNLAGDQPTSGQLVCVYVCMCACVYVCMCACVLGGCV